MDTRQRKCPNRRVRENLGRDQICYAQIPPDGKDIVSVYGANFVRSDGSSFHIGDFATQEELDDAIEKAVSDGQITQEEADTASYQ